jgi:ERCC4-type nuclease
MGLIVLDPRAGSGDLYPLLPRTDTVFGQLDAGDAMSDGWGPNGPILWGIEVKRLSDALQSLQDGRLPASQLPRMHEYFQYVFLLIEEDMRVDPKTGNLQKRMVKQVGAKPRKPTQKEVAEATVRAFTDQSKKKPKYDPIWQEYWVDVLYGARQRVIATDFLEWLISLHITGGARLLISRDRVMTAAWIVAVWKCLGKPWDKHRSLKVFDDSNPPKFVIPSKAAKVARVLADGVGWDKAMAAADYFGSAQALVNATEVEWLGVPGIGSVLAAAEFAGAREGHKRIVRRGSGNLHRQTKRRK